MPSSRTALVALAVLVTAGVCTALGLWQLGRYRERTEYNERLRTGLAAPARTLPADAAAARAALEEPARFAVHGRFDESRQFVLIGRSRDGFPGVHVITPLVRDDAGPAVLVDRGFQPADDAATVVPAPEPDTTARAVTGIVEPLEPAPGLHPRGDPLWRRTPTATGIVWSTRWLVADSVARALPYAVAPVLLRELEGEGVPAEPARSRATLANTAKHVSYAGQWFVFALIALIGPFILARTRRNRGAST